MELLCSECGGTLRVDGSKAGEVLQCPHCGCTIRVPASDGKVVPADGIASLGADEGDLADEFLTKAKLALQKRLLVVCGSCGERLTVEQRLAGRVLRCPACGEQIHILAQGDQEHIGPTGVLADTSERMEVLDAAAEDAAPPTDAATPPVAVPEAEPAEGVGRDNLGLTIFLAAAIGLAGLVIGYILWERRTGKPPAERPPIRQAVTRPVTRPTTTPATAVTTEPMVPDVRAEVKVLRTGTEVLAGGSIPAPLGKAFLYVTVRITAGQVSLAIDAAGGAVMLDSEGGKIRSLGTASTGKVVLLAAGAGTITVSPSATCVETFVFSVPEDFAGGKLIIADIGEAALPPQRRGVPPAPAAVVGTYVEAGRRLRVAFEDPIMERLRTAPEHRLIIREFEDRFEIAVPPAGLRGRARSAGNGTYAAMLTDGRNRLRCHIRLVNSGKRLILYLSEKPYHQIIYEKQ